MISHQGVRSFTFDKKFNSFDFLTRDPLLCNAQAGSDLHAGNGTEGCSCLQLEKVAEESCYKFCVFFSW